jgi:hypothetical protein
MSQIIVSLTDLIIIMLFMTIIMGKGIGDPGDTFFTKDLKRNPLNYLLTIQTALVIREFAIRDFDYLQFHFCT